MATEKKCPTCGSCIRGMRCNVLDFNGTSYFLCADPWHAEASMPATIRAHQSGECWCGSTHPIFTMANGAAFYSADAIPVEAAGPQTPAPPECPTPTEELQRIVVSSRPTGHVILSQGSQKLDLTREQIKSLVEVLNKRG